MATRAAQEGNRDGAKVMFRQIYDRDSRNERALFWLARLANDSKERQQWLKQLLKLNPEHEGAKKMLKKLQYNSAANENKTLLIGGVALIVLVTIAIAIFLLVSQLSQ